MNRTTIGLIFIIAGLLYWSTSIDAIYNRTIGWLVRNNWVSQQTVDKATKSNILGRKPTILFYSFALIIIGVFILWNRNI